MLKQVKDQLKSSVDLSSQFIEGVTERNVKFTTSMLESSLESVKALRASKSLNEALTAQVGFLTGLQSQLVSLGSTNTSALKEFGESSSKLLKESFKFGKKA
ncbi:MAG: phasin family protein [Spongiibacteraceae bacterium]